MIDRKVVLDFYVKILRRKKALLRMTGHVTRGVAEALAAQGLKPRVDWW